MAERERKTNLFGLDGKDGGAHGDAIQSMGTQYKYARVNSARGRWGSCSGENGIHYSFRLLYAPKDVVEYVVVHELAHTKYKNHSKTFWAEVAAYVPDWKVRRAWLKAHGALMEVF